MTENEELVAQRAAQKGCKELPEDVHITCYKCMRNHAAYGKQMKTPSGGHYWRGWCVGCLTGNGSRDDEPAEEETSIRHRARSNSEFRVPIGARVVVHFEGIMSRRWEKWGRYDIITIDKDGKHVEFNVPADSVEVL